MTLVQNQDQEGTISPGENLKNLSSQVMLLDYLMKLLGNDAAKGFVSAEDMSFIYRDFEILAKNYLEASDENEQVKEESLRELLLYCDNIRGYLSTGTKPKVTAMLRLVRVYSGLVKQLGWVYVGSILSHYEKYWVSIAKTPSTFKSRVVRLVLLEVLLTVIAEETCGFSRDDADDYVAVPMSWRFKMLGFFGADDPRFDRNDFIEVIFETANSEGREELSLAAIQGAIVGTNKSAAVR